MTVEELFYVMNCEKIDENPFETKEQRKACKNFEDNYVDAGNEEEWEAYIDFHDTTRRTGFVVGFKTAVSLICSGTSIPALSGENGVNKGDN